MPPPASPQEDPLISIIVATRNAAGTLQECIDSICSQTLGTWEIILIDGASTDKTMEIVARNSHRIAHCVSEPDRGVYDAWNKGLIMARGRWICFLGADDAFAGPDALGAVAAHLANAAPHRVVYADLSVIDFDGNELERVRRPWERVRKEFFAGVTMLPHPGAMHHRTLFDDHGQFEPAFRIAGDYDMLLRELRQVPPLHVGVLLVRMRVGGLSSPKNLLTGLREIAWARKRNRLPWSPRLALRLLAGRIGASILRLLGPGAYALGADAYRMATGRRPKWTGAARNARARSNP